MRQNYIPPHYIICIELLFISSFDNFFNRNPGDKQYRNIYRALYERMQTDSAKAEFLRQRRQHKARDGNQNKPAYQNKNKRRI